MPVQGKDFFVAAWARGVSSRSKLHATQRLAQSAVQQPAPSHARALTMAQTNRLRKNPLREGPCRGVLSNREGETDELSDEPPRQSLA